MSAPGIRHPVLGTDCDLNRDPQLCSLCDAPVGEVPIMVFGGARPDGDDFAWVYCEPCGEIVMTIMLTMGREAPQK